MKKASKIKLMFIDGRKQKPQDMDFLITPSLVFGQSGKEVSGLGSAFGLFLKWGFWAIGIGVFIAKLDT